NKQLQIVYDDTGSQTTSAVSIMQKFVSEGYPIILTSAYSQETLAEAPVAEKGKVLLLAAGSAADKMRDAGDYVFRLKVSVNKEIENLLGFVKNKNLKTIYILYAQIDYGVGSKKTVEELWPIMGGKIIGEEGFLPESTDFRAQLLKAKNARPDVILLASALPKNLGYILKQAKELNLNQKFIAPGGAVSPEIITIAGSAADGLVYTMEFDINSTSTATKTFRENFNKRYGKDPELFAAMGYDAAKIVAKMLKICGPNSACLKDNLYQVQNYQGASGIISFDDHGDVLKPMFYMTIKNGKFVRYE
ncbi:MAG: ABC transporter substrate-binding protein, partial [Candidatus Paceibacterota bacterium]